MYLSADFIITLHSLATGLCRSSFPESEKNAVQTIKK